MMKWTRLFLVFGAFLSPEVSPAVTTEAAIPVATVEQATYAYDAGSVRVVSDNVVTSSESLGQPDPYWGLIAKIVAAKSVPGIARITPGSLPAAEEASLLKTLGHIDAGTKPTGPVAVKWGTQFENRLGDLPGAKGAASPYLEYRVAPPAATSGAGTLRVVVNKQTGEMYYTWTHYGGAGKPAFVQIR